MNREELRDVIEMIMQTDITDFELEEDGKKLSIRRGGGQPQTTAAAPVITSSSVPEQQTAAPVAAPPSEEKNERLVDIPSPIVGTFYRAPSPDSSPYVEVGQVVEKGQVLCIVEAMKLMNEIEADFRCRVCEIFKENAQPVEYGEPLFRVEKL
ncbi:MAG: acetyl-CoA carboxylase biotin carboxyl carrier protein [Deltaproteobacteria bacterium]|nr:acetyl-CoA carboxylase biotin carboxyl carrier protein [Deltaproteobacteria bacterium]